MQTAAPGQYAGTLDVVRQTFARDGVKGCVFYAAFRYSDYDRALLTHLCVLLGRFYRGMGPPLAGGAFLSFSRREVFLLFSRAESRCSCLLRSHAYVRRLLLGKRFIFHSSLLSPVLFSFPPFHLPFLPFPPFRPTLLTSSPPFPSQGYAMGKKLVYAATPNRTSSVLSYGELAAAGFFSAVPTTLVAAPVERVKVLLQVRSCSYSRCFRLSPPPSFPSSSTLPPHISPSFHPRSYTFSPPVLIPLLRVDARSRLPTTLLRPPRRRPQTLRPRRSPIPLPRHPRHRRS
jgi:hypothetical protein